MTDCTQECIDYQKETGKSFCISDCEDARRQRFIKQCCGNCGYCKEGDKRIYYCLKDSRMMCKGDNIVAKDLWCGDWIPHVGKIVSVKAFNADLHCKYTLCEQNEEYTDMEREDGTGRTYKVIKSYCKRLGYFAFALPLPPYCIHFSEESN